MPAGDRKVPVVLADGKFDRVDVDKQRNDLFTKFVELVSVGICATDLEGRIIFWNHKLGLLTGLNPKETLGEFIWDIHLRLLPEVSRNDQTLTYLKKSFLSLLQTGQSDLLDSVSEYEYLHPDGQRLNLRGTLYAIPTQQAYGLVSLLEDVSAQKQAEVVLKTSEDTFRNVVEQANDAILIFDQNETILE